MTTKLQNLVTEAVSLDREISEQTERLKEIKAQLVEVAREREDELVPTDGGGLRWIAAKLQIAGLDISRSGVSKIEARLRYVDDKSIMFLAEVLKAPVQELFPKRESSGRLSDFMERLETTRF